MQCNNGLQGQSCYLLYSAIVHYHHRPICYGHKYHSFDILYDPCITSIIFPRVANPRGWSFIRRRTIHAFLVVSLSLYCISRPGYLSTPNTLIYFFNSVSLILNMLFIAAICPVDSRVSHN